ncbi:MAG: hypothetical protein Q9227_001328 [Pyrenula ochraceoflavens]
MKTYRRQAFVYAIRRLGGRGLISVPNRPSNGPSKPDAAALLATNVTVTALQATYGVDGEKCRTDDSHLRLLESSPEADAKVSFPLRRVRETSGFQDPFRDHKDAYEFADWTHLMPAPQEQQQHASNEFAFPWHNAPEPIMSDIKSSPRGSPITDKKEPIADENLPEHNPNPPPDRRARSEQRGKVVHGFNVEHEGSQSGSSGSPIVYGDGEKRRKRRRRRPRKHHFKRYWWIYLCVLIAVTLIVVLPVVFVAYPRIAQQQLDHSTLSVEEQRVTDPSPTDIHLFFRSQVGSQSPQHPDIYGFHADLQLEGARAPFTTIEVPGLPNSHNGQNVRVNTTVQIGDQDLFAEFAIATLTQKQVRCWIHGKTHLKQGGLPKISVRYDKMVIVNGFDGLRGLTTTDLKVLITPDSDGTNLEANVNIPNPSVMTLDLGNITLDIKTPVAPPLAPTTMNMTIGTGLLQNVQLKPGDNTFPLRSTTNQTLTLGIINANETAKSSGVLPVYVSGSKVEFNGQEIPYLTKAMQINSIYQELPMGQALAEAGVGNLLGIGSSSPSSSSTSLLARATPA